MFLLRHLVLDHMLRRVNGHGPRAHVHAHHRPSALESLLEWIEGPAVDSGRAGFGSRVRASDAEREDVVASLKRHFAEGRLDDEELNARVEAAYRAVTRAELERLTIDLPIASPTPVAAPARSRGAARPLVALASLALVAVLGIAVLSVIPAQVWVPLLTLIVPFAALALFAILPLAIPALAALWLARGADEARHLGSGHPHHMVRARRGRGWVGVWRL